MVDVLPEEAFHEQKLGFLDNSKVYYALCEEQTGHYINQECVFFQPDMIWSASQLCLPISLVGILSAISNNRHSVWTNS